MRHIGLFKELGFSEHETKIYTCMLQQGSITATKIAKETDIDAATTYLFLESLMKKGMVSYVIRNNVRYFSAAHPKQLIEKLKHQLSQVEEELPYLETLMRLGVEKTNVELYKGKEGLKTIMKDILREKKPYTFIGEVEKFFTDLSPYVWQWLREVEKRRIRGKLLCPESSSFSVAKTESYKLLSKNFISSISTWTYGEKTALFVWSTPLFGILITNKEIAKSTRQTFDFLWTLAKNPNKRHQQQTSKKP